MHYTGTIWRPPYEAGSLLLEATIGCTHHKCKFCTLYHDLPVSFRMSPLTDLEADLQEVQLWNTDPLAKLAAQLQGLSAPRHLQRVFLTGANPFVLQTKRLLDIAARIHQYLPSVETIGCFARVTDVSTKTDTDLSALRETGYDDLTIGIETGDDNALRFMQKGYDAAEIVTQCRRLDAAGIRYRFFCLAGISGSGRGAAGAEATAKICNQLHPVLIGVNMLTVFPESELFREIQRGRWTEESEREKYQEVRTLLQNLDIPAIFAALGASNAFQFQGTLPNDKPALLHALDDIIQTIPEDRLRKYRKNLSHL